MEEKVTDFITMKEQIKNLKDIAQLYEQLKTINDKLTEENKNYSRNIINLQEENKNLLSDLEYIKSDNSQVKFYSLPKGIFSVFMTELFQIIYF